MRGFNLSTFRELESNSIKICVYQSLEYITFPEANLLSTDTSRAKSQISQNNS